MSDKETKPAIQYVDIDISATYQRPKSVDERDLEEVKERCVQSAVKTLMADPVVQNVVETLSKDKDASLPDQPTLQTVGTLEQNDPAFGQLPDLPGFQAAFNAAVVSGSPFPALEGNFVYEKIEAEKDQFFKGVSTLMGDASQNKLPDPSYKEDFTSSTEPTNLSEPPKGMIYDLVPNMEPNGVIDLSHLLMNYPPNGIRHPQSTDPTHTPVQLLTASAGPRDYFNDWTIEKVVIGEIGEGVKEMAQKILDETGMSASELVANSSVNDFVNPGLMEILAEHPPLPAPPSEEPIMTEPVVIGHIESITITRGVDVQDHEIEGAFDVDNPEHMAMLQEAIEKGDIIDTHAVMEKPPLIKLEDVRETSVPIPTDLIREYFTNKGIYYLVNYSTSRLKGSNFLTYLTNLAVPSDVKFNADMTYEDYSEVMKAYLDQRSVITAPLLHVMAAELLLYAKGWLYHRLPYDTPVPVASYLERFIDENKDQIGRWLHFIDSTQVFALSAIKKLNEHYKPKEIFEIIDDKEYVGANIAQLYRIPEFIAYYFALEGAEYKLSYFQHQFEEYMFKNERLAKYFRSPHNFSAMMFEHIATGTFKGSDIGHGLFGIGVYDPAKGIPEYDPEAPAPENG